MFGNTNFHGHLNPTNSVHLSDEIGYAIEFALHIMMQVGARFGWQLWRFQDHRAPVDGFRMELRPSSCVTVEVDIVFSLLSSFCFCQSQDGPVGVPNDLKTDTCSGLSWELKLY
jgi:hypothetical protein